MWGRGLHAGPRRGGGQLSILILAPQVFQRREDGSVNFFRGWEAYRDGFGKLTGEHWLGEPPRPWACPLSLCTAHRHGRPIPGQRGRASVDPVRVSTASGEPSPWVGSEELVLFLLGTWSLSC